MQSLVVTKATETAVKEIRRFLFAFVVVKVAPRTWLRDQLVHNLRHIVLFMAKRDSKGKRVD